MSQKLMGISFLSLDIDNLSLSFDFLSGIAVGIFLTSLAVIIYQSNHSVGFSLRKKFQIDLMRKGITSYKNMASILFIDDSEVPIVQTLKDDNWAVKKVSDAQIDDPRIKEANIIFVDWKGVGKRISSEDEGIALVENIKRKYGNNKYVILYSAQEYKKPEKTIADDWVNKGSEFSTYMEKIQKAAFTLFS